MRYSGLDHRLCSIASTAGEFIIDIETEPAVRGKFEPTLITFTATLNIPLQ